MNKITFTEDAPKPIGPYAQAVRAGSTLYCAGQVPLDPKTGLLVSDNVADQTRRVLDNLFAVLGANDLSANNVVKTTVFLVDMADYPAMNEVYASYFEAEAPARTTVAVVGLPRGARIEIDAIAVANG
jgi:2-iminobutanoate/2-iminopropanoate deaminase